MAEDVKRLIERYNLKKEDIKKRLEEFKEILNQPEERVFAELAFCLCTPQSKATVCWNAICSLIKNDLLYKGGINQVRPFLNAVRFADTKVNYIVEAREKFTTYEKLQIRNFINSFNDPFKLREWLVENINGFGMKEASHFLRNIGLGDEIAILDRHIIKNLVKFGVIKEIPKILTKKKYLEIEECMKEFSEKIKIPLSELDLLFWSEETGMIFK